MCNLYSHGHGLEEIELKEGGLSVTVLNHSGENMSITGIFFVVLML